MIRPQGFLADRQRTLVERLGLAVEPLAVVQRCQIIEAGGGTGVIRPQGFLADRQGTLVERLGLAVEPLAVVQQCQIVEAGRGAG